MSKQTNNTPIVNMIGSASHEFSPPTAVELLR
jgi:hypothetical protein